MSASIATCPKCARPISRGAPQRLCPACLASSLLELLGEAEAEHLAPASAPAAPSERIGEYELLEELGRGGMGVVFRARDRRLNRIVALKLILTGRLASEAEVQRFLNEAEAAAHLEHPHIVPIYEVGESGGRHFFAMKLVEGGTLAEKVISAQSSVLSFQSRRETGEPLSPDALSTSYPPQASAVLMAKIARAVHHAHQRGILHRDLKPGNILLEVGGEPLVADFGLAKQFDVAQASSPASSGGVLAARSDSGRGRPENPSAGTPALHGLTLTGTALGSPSYMAPEQASGGSRAVTTAADIYSLGAILYELLAGRPPFVAATPLETMRKVVEEEPVPPSRVRREVVSAQCSVLSGSSDTRRRTTAHWPLSTEHSFPIDRDLETICLKCLAKEPARRYATAEALANDLERWLRREPIFARPSSAWERGAKWVRRRPALAGLLGLALLAPAVIIALQFVNEAKLKDQRDFAQEQERSAKRSAAAAQASEATMRLNLYAADMFLAGSALEQGNLKLANRTLDRHVPRAGEEDLRGFEWRYFHQQARGDQFHAFTNFTDSIFSVAFSPDGRWLAAAGANLVQWWNATNLQLFATLTHESKVRSICFSPDGATLWTGDARGQVRAWREGASQPAGLIQCGTGYVHVAMPSGAANYAAFGVRDELGSKGRGEVTLHRLADALAPNERGRVLTNSGWLAAFSHDGQWLLTGGGNSPAMLRNLVTGETKPGICHNMETSAIALSPDAGTIAISAYSGYALVLYNVAERRLIWPNLGFVGAINGLAFAPDGQTLALACSDHMIRLCRTANGRLVRRLAGQLASVYTVAFSPDGQTLAGGGPAHAARLWHLGTNAEPDTLTSVLRPIAFSPDSRTLIAADKGTFPMRFIRHDLATMQRQPGPALPAWADQYPATWHPRNGGSLPWLLGDGASSNHGAQFQEYMASCTNLAGSVCASGGSVVALGRGDGAVLVWDTAIATRLPDLRLEGGAVRLLALSGDGRLLATVGHSNVVAGWDTATGACRFRLPARRDVIGVIALSPDGRVLALGMYNTTVEVRETASGAVQSTLAGHELPPVCLAFTPDGRTLATSGSTTVKLWHLPTWREVGTLTRALDVRVLMFSPDGSVLAGANESGFAQLWRAPDPAMKPAP